MDGEDDFDIGDFIQDDFFLDSEPGAHTDDAPTSVVNPPSSSSGQTSAFHTSYFPLDLGDMARISTTTHNSDAEPSTHHLRSAVSEYPDREDLQDETQRLDLEIEKIKLQVQRVRLQKNLTSEQQLNDLEILSLLTETNKLQRERHTLSVTLKRKRKEIAHSLVSGSMTRSINLSSPKQTMILIGTLSGRGRFDSSRRPTPKRPNTTSGSESGLLVQYEYRSRP